MHTPTNDRERNCDLMAKAMRTGHEVAIDDLRREYDQLTDQKQEDNR